MKQLDHAADRFAAMHKAADAPELSLQSLYDQVKKQHAYAVAQGWSRQVSAGFTENDIEACWQQHNGRFLLRYAGHTQGFHVKDLNLRELEALGDWLAVKTA